MTRLLLLAAALVALAGGAFAQSVHFPERGSELRREVLDAARPTFQSEIGGQIEFVIERLAVLGPWAYGEVKVQRPGGGAIDWSRTKFAEDYAAGMFDPAQSLFLLREAGDGWSMVEYVIGPTDVAWDWWRQQHNIPRKLFIDE